MLELSETGVHTTVTILALGLTTSGEIDHFSDANSRIQIVASHTNQRADF